MEWKIKSLLLFLAGIVLFACGGGSELKKPSIKLPSRFFHSAKAQRKNWSCKEWWKEFGAPFLNKLIVKVLKNNYDIRLASEKILEMKAMVAQVRARRFPWFSVSGEASTIHFEPQSSSSTALMMSMPGTAPASPPPSPSSSKDHIETYDLSLMASYEVDLWKKLSSAEKSVRWKLLATKWNQQTVINTLTAETALKYFQTLYLTRKISFLKKKLSILKKQVSVLKERYKKGEIPYLKLKEAEVRYYQLLSALPELEKEKELSLQALSMLAGSFSTLKLQKRELPEITPGLPPFLPSDLLKRRPDVMFAEAMLKSAKENFYSVRAERFPKITLTGSLGFISTELKNFFSGDNFLWKLSAGITAPIFNAGYFKARTEMAKSQYRQALITYAKTVLNAFWDVEKCLLLEEKLKKEYETKKKLFEETQKIYEFVKKRYSRGVSDYLDLLNAELNLINAKEGLLDVRFKLLANRISIYRALGGGTELCLQKQEKQSR